MEVCSSKFIRFVDACVKQAENLPEYSSKFSRKDYTLRQHVVLLCLKIKLKQRYREFCEIIDLMPEIKQMLGLDKTPHWTTLDKVFLKLRNHVFAALLQTDCSGYVCIDATSFDRGHASLRYQIRCKLQIKSLKATFLVDMHKQEIVDVHCTMTRKHDTKIVLPLTKHYRLRVLCADMGYDDRKVRNSLKSRGVRPIIPYRQFMKKHRYWNSMIDMKLYHKRSISETVNSVIKRKYTDTLYSKDWRNQFKELKLLAIVYNIDRKVRIYLRFSTELVNHNPITAGCITALQNHKSMTPE